MYLPKTGTPALSVHFRNFSVFWLSSFSLSFRGQLSVILTHLVLYILKTCPIRCHLHHSPNLFQSCSLSLFKNFLYICGGRRPRYFHLLFLSSRFLSHITKQILHQIWKASLWCFFQPGYYSILVSICGRLFLHALAVFVCLHLFHLCD